MSFADLLGETLETVSQDVWENERALTPVQRFGVRIYAAGLSINLMERSGIGVHTLSEAQSDPPTASLSRSMGNNRGDSEKNWLYAAIDTESRLLVEINVFSHCGTDPAAAFLHRLTEKHEFLSLSIFWEEMLLTRCD